MSTWLTPSTAVNGAVTAAFWNTEVRDHLNWLKAALDLITESTASDVGDTTRILIARGLATNAAISTLVTGDAFNRLNILSTGKLQWSSGAATNDTDMSRTGVAELTVTGRLKADHLEPTDTTDALRIPNGYMEINERSDPAAPPANWARIYVRDNGAGKTQVVARFSSGAIQPIATQP